MKRFSFPIILLLLARSLSLNAQIHYAEKFIPKEAEIPAYVDTVMAGGEVTCQVLVDMGDTLNPSVSNFIYGNNATAYHFNLFGFDVDYDAEIMQNLRDLNPNILRWPGGSLSDVYFWDGNSPGWMADDPDLNPWYGNDGSWWLSLNEYYRLLEQSNSTGIIVVNFGYSRYGRTADPVATAAGYAADWVRYDNGRTKYWELGNENFGTWEAGYEIDTDYNQDGQPELMTADIYGRHCKVYIDSMQAAAAEIGSDIEIGIVLYEDAHGYTDLTRSWNAGVLPHVGNKADFSILHNYFTPYNQNSSANVILDNYDKPGDFKNYVDASFTDAGLETLPITMTEYNIFAVGSSQMISHVNGLHAVLVLGELAKYDYTIATRWNLNNGYNDGNDHGMFSGGHPGIEDMTPYSDFYHLYYFQKFFGDKVVNNQVTGTSGVVAHSSAFSSGEAGVVLVNKGDQDEVVEMDINNFLQGERYYWYLVEGEGSAEFTQRLLLNGKSAETGRFGPENFKEIKARSVRHDEGKLRVDLPARSALYLMAEAPTGPRISRAATGTQQGKLHLNFHTYLEEPADVDGLIVLTGTDQRDTITDFEWHSEVPDSLVLLLRKELDPDQKVYLSYEGSSIVSVDGLPMLTFDSLLVENLLDGSAPELMDSYCSEDGMDIMMLFNKEMEGSGALVDFLVESGDPLKDFAASSLALDPEDSRVLILGLVEALKFGDPVWLSYQGNSVLAADGGVLKDFAPVEVENLSLSIPVLQGSSFDDYGYKLELNFSEKLAATASLENVFSLSQSGTDLTIDETILDEATIVLSLQRVPLTGEDLKLSYSGGNLESAQGVTLLAFTDYVVENTLDYQVVDLPTLIEAEDFVAESGIYLSSCIEGGLNTKSADPGDWLEYEIQVPETGVYTFHYRYSLAEEPGSFELFSSLEEDALHLVSPERTWHEQYWDTVIHLAELPQGRQRIKFLFKESGIGLNWFQIDKGDSRPVGVKNQSSENMIRIFPNPARELLHIQCVEAEIDEIVLMDLCGRRLLQKSVMDTSCSLHLDFPAGVYRVIVKIGDASYSRGILLY